MARYLGAPAGYKIQLDQSNLATLTWSPVAGATGYDVITTAFDGRSQQIFSPVFGQAFATDNTNGAATCYTPRGLAGTGVSGMANTLCGVPGVTTFGPRGSVKLITPSPIQITCAARSVSYSSLDRPRMPW